MKIVNLNKQFITKEDILREIGEINVYKHYSKTDVKLNHVGISPLRREKNPSFGYFVRKGEILFNDFVLGGGDCVKFVMLMFNLTWFEALSKIAIDFQIDDGYIVKRNLKTESSLITKSFSFDDKASFLEHSNKLIIQIKSRKWRMSDFYYWNEYGIKHSTLEHYDVIPVEYIFLNGQPIKADKYAYAFRETKDNNVTYKIYQPFSEKYKWINNHNNSIWQGWTKLPKSGKDLVITKSLKDVMSITSLTGIPAISLQAESTKPKDHIIQELKDRFNYIFILYDNDYDSEINWGQQFSSQLSKKYGFIEYKIPTRFKCKDFSDLIKKYGVNEALNIWTQYIHFPF